MPPIRGNMFGMNAWHQTYERLRALAIDGVVIDRQLQFHFGYAAQRSVRAEATELPTLFVERLRELIRECEKGGKGAAGAVTPSDFPLVANLTQSVLDGLMKSVVGPQCEVKDIEDIYPATPMQEGYDIPYDRGSAFASVHNAIQVDDSDGNIRSRAVQASVATVDRSICNVANVVCVGRSSEGIAGGAQSSAVEVVGNGLVDDDSNGDGIDGSNVFGSR